MSLFFRQKVSDEFFFRKSANKNPLLFQLLHYNQKLIMKDSIFFSEVIVDHFLLDKRGRPEGQGNLKIKTQYEHMKFIIVMETIRIYLVRIKYM